MVFPLVVRGVPAGGLPVVDEGRYAQILKDLKSLQDQIKQWSGAIKAANESIQTLGAISDGIRDLKGVISGGVRGLSGEIVSAIGLDDILAPLGDAQGIYNDASSLFGDTQSLIRDIRDLPAEAKRQLDNIGVASSDVKTFLSEGLMYDTFDRLGVDEWKTVAKNPLRALQTGSFGIALSRSEDYLTPAERNQAWSEYISSLDQNEQKAMAGLIGPQFVAHQADQWYQDMEKRSKESLDMRNVANKLEDAVNGPKGKTTTDKDIVSDIVTDNATAALNLKIGVKAMADDNNAAQTIMNAERERTRLKRETNDYESAKQATDAVLGQY